MLRRSVCRLGSSLANIRAASSVAASGLLLRPTVLRAAGFSTHSSKLMPIDADSVEPPPQLEDPEAPGLVSGVPEDVRHRVVYIYRPSRTPTQHAPELVREWVMEYKMPPKWQDPLMGWTSSPETASQQSLKFETKEQAIDFARRQGHQIELGEPHESIRKPKAYADNFKFKRMRGPPSSK